MALVDTKNLISISDAARLGVSALARDAEVGHERVLVRNNQPVAAVVSMDHLEQLQQLEDDLIDISLAAARMLTADAHRYSLDDVLAMFGYTREQLREIPE